MNYINCQGIVIKKVDYGEADRLIDIFTRELGRITTTIKGIRKSKKREQISSDIMTNSKFIFYKKKDKFIISDFIVNDPYIDLKSDMENIDIAICIVGILSEILVYEEPKEKLYDVTIKSLETLRKTKNAKKKYMLLGYFLFFIIRGEGLTFDLEESSKNFWKSDKKIEDKNYNNILVDTNLRHILEAIYFNDKNKIGEIISNKGNYKIGEIIQIIFYLEKYINFHLGINLKLKNYLMGVTNG